MVTFGEGQQAETTLTAIDANPYLDSFVALYSVTGLHDRPPTWLEATWLWIDGDELPTASELLAGGQQ